MELLASLSDVNGGAWSTGSINNYFYAQDLLPGASTSLNFEITPLLTSACYPVHIEPIAFTWTYETLCGSLFASRDTIDVVDMSPALPTLTVSNRVVNVYRRMLTYEMCVSASSTHLLVDDFVTFEHYLHSRAQNFLISSDADTNITCDGLPVSFCAQGSRMHFIVPASVLQSSQACVQISHCTPLPASNGLVEYVDIAMAGSTTTVFGCPIYGEDLHCSFAGNQPILATVQRLLCCRYSCSAYLSQHNCKQHWLL